MSQHEQPGQCHASCADHVLLWCGVAVSGPGACWMFHQRSCRTALMCWPCCQGYGKRLSGRCRHSHKSTGRRHPAPVCLHSAQAATCAVHMASMRMHVSTGAGVHNRDVIALSTLSYKSPLGDAVQLLILSEIVTDAQTCGTYVMSCSHCRAVPQVLGAAVCDM